MQGVAAGLVGKRCRAVMTRQGRQSKARQGQEKRPGGDARQDLGRGAERAKKELEPDACSYLGKVEGPSRAGAGAGWCSPGELWDRTFNWPSAWGWRFR
jgi:hypothetical protein